MEEPLIRPATPADLPAIEAIGGSWQTILHQDDRELAAEQWAHTGAEGRPFRGMLRLQRPDGEVRWLENSDAARVVSFERAVAGQGESFAVVVNLSSQPFSGTVNAPAGVWEDITPAAVAAAVTLPKISLAAWEFRVFQRR